MRTHNIPSSCHRKSKRSLLSLLTWRYYQPHWLELPLSRTNFHGPKGVRAIEVRLYLPKPLQSSTSSFCCSLKFGKPKNLYADIRSAQNIICGTKIMNIISITENDFRYEGSPMH